jgi:hypothetical protein
MESGIVGKRGLFCADDFICLFDGAGFSAFASGNVHSFLKERQFYSRSFKTFLV